MSHSYLYAAVQCRDVRAFQEIRTVGAVVLAPEARFAELRFMPLQRKLADGEVSFVRGVLEAWKNELAEVIASGQTAAVAWLRDRAGGAEDAVRLTSPAVGLGDDLASEAKRLFQELTGYKPIGRQTPTERVVSAVLRRNHISKRFQPTPLNSDLAEWKYALVCGRHVLHTVDFDQARPAGVLDAAFRDVGRFGEIRRRNRDLDVVAVAAPAEDAVAERARDIYREHGIEVVAAHEPEVEDALGRRGLIEGSGRAWTGSRKAHVVSANERRHRRT